MKTIILDIETTARPETEIADLLPSITAPSNWKDEAKIAAYVAEKRAQAIAEGALDPVLGRVLAVGVLVDGAFEFVGWPEERQLLRDTWHRLEGMFRAGTKFVTFNGHRFDFPFLARRSWACGVAVPSWIPRDGRWPRHAFVDLLEVWQAGNRTESIGLDRLARLCGLPGKAGNGANFGLLWASDRPAALRYLEQDLRLTASLAERMLVEAEPEPGDRL